MIDSSFDELDDTHRSSYLEKKHYNSCILASTSIIGINFSLSFTLQQIFILLRKY